MATCKNCGKQLILQGGKCIHCGASPNLPTQQAIRQSKPIVQRRTFSSRQKSVEDLKIKVTSPNYDDIGKILTQLSVRYVSFDGNYDCDILFLNCGTGDSIDAVQLRNYVKKGGLLYASDLTSKHIIEAWPDLMTVNNNTVPCTIRAKIVDPDLRQYLGSTIDVEFDMGVWSKVVGQSKGKILMQSAEEGFPIMLEFSLGQGKVFYTSFHNHAQTDEAEKKLLQLLVIKQVSSATKQDFRKTVASMPVSFN